MLHKDPKEKREQVQLMSVDELVPKDHLLRDIERTIDFDFIYGLVKDKYSAHAGRPSVDPVVLIKIVFIQHLFGIRSMRQTIKEIEVNAAYRWFLGFDFTDRIPHFTTFGKNYTRRFKGTDLFEQIFERILDECMNCGFVDSDTLFVDATHIKAHANNKKWENVVVQKEARFYEDELQKEIQQDRKNHGKRPLKDRKGPGDDDPPSGAGREKKVLKQSKTDPESGLFRKGEHKQVFAYSAQTACDRHGWILGYSIHPGNDHDSKTFPALYEKLKRFEPNAMVMDAGYKTPAIARMLLEDGILPHFPYTRPMTGKGLFRKHEYVYDEQYDCYLCPNNQVLAYATTNREGSREYKSKPSECRICPLLKQCTHSKNHQKVVCRHVWQKYLDRCEDIRHEVGSKETYNLRKETVERIFGEAKENHGLRFTQSIGRARMRLKVGLTFACLNLKKLAKMKRRHGLLAPLKGSLRCRIIQVCRYWKKKRQNEFSVAI